MKAMEVELHQFLTSALDEGGSQLYVLAALPQEEKTAYSLTRKRDGPEGWSGKDRNLLILTGFKHCTVQPVILWFPAHQ